MLIMPPVEAQCYSTSNSVTHSKCATELLFNFYLVLSHIHTHAHINNQHTPKHIHMQKMNLPIPSPSFPLSRTQWKKCTFSGDGEFIVAGSHRQHALYIWDKGTGSLAKMLTGQKGETLLDIAVSGSCDNHMLYATGEIHVHVRLYCFCIALFPGSRCVRMKNQKIFCTTSNGKLGGAWERG